MWNNYIQITFTTLFGWSWGVRSRSARLEAEMKFMKEINGNKVKKYRCWYLTRSRQTIHTHVMMNVPLQRLQTGLWLLEIITTTATITQQADSVPSAMTSGQTSCSGTKKKNPKETLKWNSVTTPTLRLRTNVGWNISTTIGWFPTKFGADIHRYSCYLQNECIIFGDPLNLYVTPYDIPVTLS